MATFKSFVATWGLLLAAAMSHAAALSPSKATDGSVCDLAPKTTDELAYRTFISADQPLDQEALGYKRLASDYIVGHCAQGQILVLGSKESTELDGRYLQDLAIELCVASDVARTAVDSVDPLTGNKMIGYELRCRISKFDAFRSKLQLDEAKESTPSLMARLRGRPPASTTSGSLDSSSNGAPKPPKVDCGKLTLSALMFGGGGCN